MSTTTTPLLSVVICFRDWGLDRLSAAVRAHLAQGLPLEVVVSDYGSRDAQEVRDAVEPLGARVARTDTDGPWNRSASLNAGVLAARAPFVVTTDADIVFSPTAYSEALRLLQQAPDTLFLIQCRDLSERFGAEQMHALLDQGGTAWWRQLDRDASVRPRWGMGGFAAFSRAAFDRLHGYEERMQIWGSEDNDFAQRMARLGAPGRWLSHPEARIFHIWHAPSAPKAMQSDEGREQLNQNKAILAEDRSTVRNLGKRMPAAAPPVSIIVPTYKRAGLLRDCLLSCQRQSFADFECLVVENGDSDEAEPVVRSLADPRFRYLKTPKQGAAAARNHGLDAARGRWIVIHDDDDLMLETRVADHLRATAPGCLGSYSGWIDFEHEGAKLLDKHGGKEFSYPALLFNGKVLTHGALMLDARLFRLFRYEEGLAAGIDYGFVLQLARNGMQLRHTGRYGILRRMHTQNMTRTNAAVQKSAAQRMAQLMLGEWDVATQKAQRQLGLAAIAMGCDNEAAALAELAELQAQSGALAFDSLQSIDDWLQRVGDERRGTLMADLSPALQALVQTRLALRGLQV
jgi:glycosyltransferase involved in cell wall biosynthesis